MRQTEIVSELVAKAVEQLGSSEKLAKACGVGTSAITNAKRKGQVSAELAVSIDLATEGKISASDLRPDLWLKPEHVPIVVEER
jgi:DNA-binding transcriptional regulator YdaS (Cro superfamily)